MKLRLRLQTNGDIFLREGSVERYWGYVALKTLWEVTPHQGRGWTKMPHAQSVAR